MNCNHEHHHKEKLGTDWSFLFVLKNENLELQELLNYSYEFLLIDKNNVTVVTRNGAITTPGNELAVTISANETSNFESGVVKAAFKLVSPNGSVDISDTIEFEAVETLFSNT